MIYFNDPIFCIIYKESEDISFLRRENCRVSLNLVKTADLESH